MLPSSILDKYTKATWMTTEVSYILIADTKILLESPLTTLSAQYSLTMSFDIPATLYWTQNLIWKTSTEAGAATSGPKIALRG